ncbi:MAG TPA: multiheme c-type cytochrome [Thermoanaerobaculia bacterium]|nr:multiheme c-type cytochrome [Thermoanaerobaculia bacterium]
MKKFLRDGHHLLRVAALFAAGFAAFLVMRGLLVPADFGRFGHYRAGALADNAGRPVSYAGKTACLDCHSDVADAQKGSRHANVRCEACHGPLAKHAENPDVKPAKPSAEHLCLTCHRQIAGRPAKFPQVDPDEHAGGVACTSCHKPHHPEEGTTDAKETKGTKETKS